MTGAAENASECAHCGLRLGRRVVSGEIGGIESRFCCGGCLLAANVTRARGDESVAAALLVRLGLAAFFSMNVMMLTLPTYARHVYGETAEGPLFVVLRGLAAVLAVPVLFLLGGPLFAAARQGLARGQWTSDLLVVLAVAAAFGLSVANLVAGRPDTYFDTTVMLLVLVTGGRYVEATAKARATAALRRESPGPRAALRIRGGRREEVEPGVLRPGDVVEVGPGGAFPADCRILEGEADVDESVLTGEGRPRWKGVGSAVAGGTVNLDGVLRMRVERAAADSALARIEELLDEARSEPVGIERSVDRVATFVIPLVLWIAAGAGGWWGFAEGVDEGVLAAVAVLVVACPCGLVLATPVTIARGLSAAVERGIVLRSAAVLERAARVRRVFFDKTGTLTGPAPRLDAIERRSGARTADELLAFAAAVEEGIAHPFARAIVAEARRRGLRWPKAQDVRSHPGRGAFGLVDGVWVGVGAGDLFGALGLSVSRPAGVTVATRDGDEAALEFRDALVPDAEDALREIRSAGLSVRLVSGDPVAPPAGFGSFGRGEISTGLSPAGKRALLERARREDRGAIAMVGDGVNDAPVLAAADVGVAVATATDLARFSADAVILAEGLSAVPWLFAHARRVRRVVHQNLFWALAYNSVAVGMAAASKLDPLVAAVAMIGSSILVLGNASRVAGEKRTEGSPVGPPRSGIGIATPETVRRAEALS